MNINLSLWDVLLEVVVPPLRRWLNDDDEDDDDDDDDDDDEWSESWLWFVKVSMISSFLTGRCWSGWQVITMVFQYMQLIRSEGIKESIFQEIYDIDHNEFRYLESVRQP